jgi:hypothetical protein
MNPAYETGGEWRKAARVAVGFGIEPQRGSP